MTFVYTYLTLGFIYAMYIWLFAGDPWYAIPVNIVGGPIVFVREIIRAYARRRVSVVEMFAKKKAVIFDLDGTIIDSQPFKDKAMDNILKTINAGWVTREYSHGLNEIEKWDYTLKHEKEINTKFTVQELADHTKKEYLKIYTEVEPLPGFWDFMHYLKKEKNMKVGLATNSDREVTNTVLKRMGAENVFDFTIAGDEVKKRKPNPEIYKRALKEMGLKSSEVLVFEDSVVGATASDKAGLDTIVVWDGVDSPQDEYPKNVFDFIPDFKDMGEYLEKDYFKRLEEGVKIMEELGEV